MRGTIDEFIGVLWLLLLLLTAISAHTWIGALAELYTCTRDVNDVFRKLHRLVALRVVVDQKNTMAVIGYRLQSSSLNMRFSPLGLISNMIQETMYATAMSVDFLNTVLEDSALHSSALPIYTNNTRNGPLSTPVRVVICPAALTVAFSAHYSE